MTFSLATVKDGATSVAAIKMGDSYWRIADAVPELADAVARRGCWASSMNGIATKACCSKGRPGCATSPA